MERVLEMMRDALVSTWEAARPWLMETSAGLPVYAWLGIVALLLLWLLALPRRPNRSANGDKPELLLTRAELEPHDDANGAYRLVAGFSNLHYEPVQLLRIAASGADRQRAVAESTALVAARRAVEIEADLDIGGGGTGHLELYLYVPSSTARAWRLRVPLTWEPWSRRYTAVPLEQRLTPVRHLPEMPERGRGVPPELDAHKVRERGRLGFPDDF